MHSLRATICAASVVAFSLVAPLSAVADTVTPLAPLSADPALAAASAKGSAVVKLDACTVGGSNGRSASFSSKMEGGTSASMELRFDLLTRPISGGEWTAVKGVPKFGVWDRPSSSSVVWSKSVGGLTVGQSYRVLVTHRWLSKSVGGLTVGQSYRVLVTHRWLSKSGRVIRRVVLPSAVCDQPDTRPDLTASFVGARALSNGSTLYTLIVRNVGFGAARGFSVAMRVNGVELPTARVTSLGARKSLLVTFTAAACKSGSILRGEADFSKEVVESSEANNVIETACPSMGG
ncbi:MAG: hypothetical protein NTZ58_01015 [Solirubrobacterales bacterium]|nr:hypothetical protein [Solirubrobacterales bacterium]